MISPKQLNEFLEKTQKLFELSSVFISNQEGQLLSCSPQSDSQSFTSVICSLWMDFHFILKTQSKEEQLQQILVESDATQVYLGNLQNALIFGVVAPKSDNLGAFLKQAQMMHQFINQELKAICT